jgi:predicted transcriptional regulator
MPRSKRSSLELTADVLGAALEGAKKTAIMYRANLSFDLLNRYLDLLTTKKVLLVRDEFGLYWVSPRGMKFLREYNSYKKTKSAYFRKSKAVNEFLE